jgi:hypothetical protein
MCEYDSRKRGEVKARAAAAYLSAYKPGHAESGFVNTPALWLPKFRPPDIA